MNSQLKKKEENCIDFYLKKSEKGCHMDLLEKMT